MSRPRTRPHCSPWGHGADVQTHNLAPNPALGVGLPPNLHRGAGLILSPKTCPQTRPWVWGCPITYDWGLGLIPSPTTCPQTEPWVWGCPLTYIWGLVLLLPPKTCPPIYPRIWGCPQIHPTELPPTPTPSPLQWGADPPPCAPLPLQIH